MNTFDKVMMALIAAAGVTGILFFWVLAYVMLVQAGVFG